MRGMEQITLKGNSCSDTAAHNVNFALPRAKGSSNHLTTCNYFCMKRASPIVQIGGIWIAQWLFGSLSQSLRHSGIQQRHHYPFHSLLLSNEGKILQPSITVLILCWHTLSPQLR